MKPGEISKDIRFLNLLLRLRVQLSLSAFPLVHASSGPLLSLFLGQDFETTQKSTSSHPSQYKMNGEC